jgi:tellurite resistance protein
MSTSETARRARTLLDKKIAEESSLLSRFRKKPGSSTADEFFSGLVEGAFLLAAADGDLSEDEEIALSETLREITGGMFEPEEFVQMLHAFEEALQEDGQASRLQTLASSLPDEPARRAVLSFATLVALCDRHLADAEWSALQAMGAAFGFSKQSVEALVNEAQEGLQLRSAPGIFRHAQGRICSPPSGRRRQGGVEAREGLG